MSHLEEKLDALIAREGHVRPEDVTLEYIRDERENSEMYRQARFNFSTRYGGYIRKHGRVLTPSTAREMVNAAYKFLSKFGHHA